MKLPDNIITEQELLKQKVRCYTMINGYLSAGFFSIVGYIIYKIIGAII